MVYDLNKLKEQQNDEPEHVELYPSELSEIKVLSARLQRKYGFTKMDESRRAEFVREVEGEFEKLGLRARVTWSLDVSGDTDTNLFHIPTVSIAGRTERNVETDFERIQHEVVSGEADGKVGYIREDGTRREDVRKKNI